jgi:hypothetical protein
MNARTARIVFLVLAAVAFIIAILDPKLLDIQWQPTGLLMWVFSFLVEA